MRRIARLLVVALALGAAAPEAMAKFGISKTHVTLVRQKPPEAPILAETLAVDVRSAAPEVTGSHVSLVRGRLEEALAASHLYQLVPRPRDADALVKVTLDALQAEVRDEVEMESHYVKIGEKQVWDEKKKKYKDEDVWGNRDEPVTYRVASGSVGATLEVEAESGRQTRDASASYSQRYKSGSGVPSEASSEESLRRYLIGQAAGNAVALVTYAPQQVDALLAVDGELKPGNKQAEEGRFEAALAEWERQTYKGDKEAARQHNVGVAHEALAYGLPPHSPEHMGELQKAREFYRSARQLDPGEKYFKDPLERIELSLHYAETAAQQRAALEQLSQARAARRETPAPVAQPAVATAPAAVTAPPAAPKPKAAAPPRSAKPKAVEPPAQPVPILEAPPQVPLRNGSFEASLAPWSASPGATVVSEAGRGRVLEVNAVGVGGHASQAVGVQLAEGATLSLDYKVTSGESRIRLLLGYLDAGGKARTATLEITAGEGPGAWSPWSADLAGLRPKPARITEIKAVVEGGTVRLDNVALTQR